MPLIHAADRPALSTIPNIEILEVGTWATSTGVFTFTQDDLFAAVAAFDDPGYSRPILKLGHIDPRFDGEPALGRLINPRLADDGMTLIVDLAGVPTWLADIAASAFPRRSIEGQFDHVTQTGSKHRFALTALSLLGVQAPAVSTLADIALLYGLDPVAVAASAATSLEESMPASAVPPGPVPVSASVNLDKVRQTFYSYDDEGSKKLRAEIGGWPWVREVYNDFIVVDDDEGNLFQVPWSEDAAQPGEVTWGSPAKVRVEYVATSDAVAASDGLRRGALRARLASMTHAAADAPPFTPESAEVQPVEPDATPTEAQPAAPESAPTTEPEAPEDVPAAEPDVPTIQEDDMSLSAIRARLGLADDADEAAVLAALDAKLPGQPDASTEPDIPAVQPEPQPVAAATKPLPEGVVVIDEATLNELRRNASLGAQAAERQRVSDRDRYIDDAVAAGKIAPARKDHWVKSWEADPDGTKAVLGSLEAGLVVPVVAAGVLGNGDESADDVGMNTSEIDAWARQLGVSAEELTR